jgi:Fungal Zn(2)-Cys(6) binuclear cluster domain
MTLKAELRRNGKPKACEPCRKGKMACDHALPFCGRCTRRRMTSRRIYHPAPMTREKPPQLIVPAARTNTELVSTISKRPGCSSYDLGADGKLPPSIGGSVTERGTHRRGLFKCSTGFQGATSFSAIFAENQAKFHLSTSELEKEVDSILCSATTTKLAPPLGLRVVGGFCG